MFKIDHIDNLISFVLKIEWVRSIKEGAKIQQQQKKNTATKYSQSKSNAQKVIIQINNFE